MRQLKSQQLRVGKYEEHNSLRRFNIFFWLTQPWTPNFSDKT